MNKPLSPAQTGLFYFKTSSLCRYLLVLTFSFLFFASCEWTGKKVSNKPVLQVNEYQLSAKDFADQLARRLKGFDALSAKDPQNIKRAKDDIIRNYTLRFLLMDFAKKEGLVVDDSEVEKEINSFRTSYPDDITFRRALAEESLSMADWKDEIRATLIEKKVFQKITENSKKPTEEEITKYYEENKSLYKRSERIYLRQIITDELSKAQSIRDELKKKDFVDMAKKFSVAPEAKLGGLVGWVEKGSVDIFDKAFNLPIGSLSPVLESTYGFHIFKVEKKLPPGFASKEEVRTEIVQSLMAKKEQAEFASWLDRQIRATRVLKDTVLIDAISVETRGVK